MYDELVISGRRLEVEGNTTSAPKYVGCFKDLIISSRDRGITVFGVIEKIEQFDLSAELLSDIPSKHFPNRSGDLDKEIASALGGIREERGRGSTVLPIHWLPGSWIDEGSNELVW